MSNTLTRMMQRQRANERSTERTATQDSPRNTALMSYARFMALPATRGFWPFTSINESASIIDMSGQARTLTAAGSPAFGVMTNGGAYATFNGSTTYYYRADEAGLDITGNLALMAWAYCAASTTQVIAAKSNTSQVSYQLYTNSSNQFVFTVSSDGTTLTTVTATATYTAAAWYFVAGVYEASTSLKVYWGPASPANTAGGVATNTTSIPAALHSGTAQFRIGANQVGSLLTGRGAYVWLGSYALPANIISDVYEGTRDLFAA